MKKIIITDVTLRKGNESGEKLSFKERTETAKLLDKLGTDVIDVGGIADRTDLLFLHTISPIIKKSIISCNAGLTEESACEAWKAVSGCENKRLYISVPASTVQMEYLYGKKAAAMLETLEIMAKKIVSLDANAEVEFIDATRSEKDFLVSAINTAVSCGIKNISVCDTAGDMLPDEMAAFIGDITSSCNLCDCTVSVECSDKMNLGTSCAVSAIKSGANGAKIGFCDANVTDAVSFAKVISTAGDRLGVSSGIDMTALNDTAEKIAGILAKNSEVGTVGAMKAAAAEDDTVLSENDTISEVTAAIKKLGYELSEEDNAHVFDEVHKVAAKKKVTMTELDAIVASVALQVPSTYKLKSFVINTGNVITATAHVELTKGAETFSGISIGDGPVDAAFMAIEKIIGHHFDLDDFSIQSLTEGREAVGTSIVKLRSGSGKLYSGKGVSTDIIGGAIKAYINALNKICFEEN